MEAFTFSNGGVVYLWTPCRVQWPAISFWKKALIGTVGAVHGRTDHSAITLNGVAHFLVGDHNNGLYQRHQRRRGFVADIWNHQLVFSASNTYAGPTIIGDGPQVALAGNGLDLTRSLIFFGGNNPSSVHWT